MPDATHPTAGTHRVTCPHCDHVWQTDRQTGALTCSQCQSNVRVLRGVIANHEGNLIVSALAEGPKTRAEIDGQIENEREFVHRLKPPSRSAPALKSRPEATIVYYLEGDDREAMRRFIAANEAYVADCLADTSNPLAQNWSTHQYTLLLEQWHLGGHAARHRTTEGDDA